MSAQNTVCKHCVCEVYRYYASIIGRRVVYLEILRLVRTTNDSGLRLDLILRVVDGCRLLVVVIEG